MKKLVALPLVILSALPLNVLAQELPKINLDRISLSYNTYSDSDSDSASGGQLTISNSFGESDNWVFHGDVSGISYDDYDISGSTSRIGIGYSFYGKNSASIISAGVGKIDVSGCYGGYCASADENFTFTRLDFIYATSKKLEINAAISAENMTVGSESETTVNLTAGASYLISDSFSIDVSYTTDDDSNSNTSLGFSYRF